jgi:hypothetical protein
MILSGSWKVGQAMCRVILRFEQVNGYLISCEAEPERLILRARRPGESHLQVQSYHPGRENWWRIYRQFRSCFEEVEDGVLGLS